MDGAHNRAKHIIQPTYFDEPPGIHILFYILFIRADFLFSPFSHVLLLNGSGALNPLAS